MPFVTLDLVLAHGILCAYIALFKRAVAFGARVNAVNACLRPHIPHRDLACRRLVDRCSRREPMLDFALCAMARAAFGIRGEAQLAIVLCAIIRGRTGDA